MKKLKNVAIVISMLVFLSGCAEVLLVGAGAGLGVASYMYVDGLLAVEYPLEYKRAWNAANKALENFQISISHSENENGKGLIEAVRKDGKNVTVKFKDEGNGITTVAVRVGALGSRIEAQKIHDEITSVAGI